MSKKVAIVGAGVGGLATAARLAQRGYQVQVFEKLAACGGRCHLLEDKGFKFDMGPSFVLMPDFFEEVFQDCKENIKDYLNLVSIDPSYKLWYPDGETFTAYRDSEQTKAELERIEKGAALKFESFIAETRRLYNEVRPLLYNCFTPQHALNPRYWSLIGKIRAFDSYWNLARKFFRSEKLCYAFTFEAMFMGVSPFNAPAFYSIISYADHVQKIFHPLGGMYQIPLALKRMAMKFGARFQFNAQVQRITERKGHLQVRVENADHVFEQVVVNADYAYAQADILERTIPNFKYSCSVFLIYLGLNQKLKGLAHHNLFFAKDLRNNLSQIFKTGAIPADPSFYVHVPTITDPSLAPEGKEIVYILIPVANLQGSREDVRCAQERLRSHVFEKIKQATGVALDGSIEVEHRFYPDDFVDRYNIRHGATFGLAHNLMQSAFFRPPNLDREIKNLFFVGASTQPGGGLPVVIASSRIVADLIQKDRRINAF
ncbi:MAG: phytoene desaturase [Candidatus Omnitrophica bacterium]|nr:phytoene desaturase [Candidatus Omnitrophota bacterium]